MAKLSKYWADAFLDSFETEEEVIEFICEHIDTTGWEDSYKNMGFGDPNESFKVTASDKKEALYDFVMSLISEKSACPCCQGGEPIAEMDDAAMFVDESGNFAVYADDIPRTHVIKGRFMHCPICGRKLEL